MPNIGSTTQFFPRAVEGFVTTLASTISAGATTITSNSTAGYSVGDVIVWIIDPSSTTAKQVLTGTVAAGNQIINVVWTYGTNQTHTAGATIVDYTTATGFDLHSAGILKHANQDGSLLQSPVLTAIGTGGITSTQIADGSIQPVDLQTGTGSTWVWQSWAPTFTGITLGNGTVVARYNQTGKTVNFRILITFGSTTTLPTGADNVFTAPVPPSATAYPQYNNSIGTGMIVISTNNYPLISRVYSSTQIEMAGLKSNGTTSVTTYPITTGNLTMTTGNTIQLSGSYEAA